MKRKKVNLILMILCMAYLFNQVINIPDNSLNYFIWITIGFNIIIIIQLARVNFNLKLLYVKKTIIAVIICSLYLSIGTWALDYNMHGYVESGDKINLYVEYENITKLPLEIDKVITIGKENSKEIESTIEVEEDGNMYIINTYFKKEQIKEVDSVSNLIIFKMFKIIPFVKISKVTYNW